MKRTSRDIEEDLGKANIDKINSRITSLMVKWRTRSNIVDYIKGNILFRPGIIAATLKEYAGNLYDREDIRVGSDYISAMEQVNIGLVDQNYQVIIQQFFAQLEK